MQRHRRGALEHGLYRSRPSCAAVHPRPAPSRVPARKRCTPLQALAAARRHSRGRITWLVLCPLLTAVRPRRSTEADCGRQARHEPRYCHRSPFGWGPTGRISPSRLGQRRGVMLYRNHPHGQKREAAHSATLAQPAAVLRSPNHPAVSPRRRRRRRLCAFFGSAPGRGWRRGGRCPGHHCGRTWGSRAVPR